MKTITGKVISAKMIHTAVVEVVRFIEHPVYHKRIRRTKKFHAHDEIGVKEGDQVRLVETKPISKTKFWKIVEVVK